jgi:multiple sugar transport system substrate-binding protein
MPVALKGEAVMTKRWLSLLGLAGGLTLAGGGGVLAQESAADRAVEAAKEYEGTEITIVWEAGLQSLDPLNYSAPRWKELTGIDVQVIEVPTAEMFTKILQEHRAGTGAYDALNVIPSWMPDLVHAGALEPLDSYIDNYGYRDGLQDIAPVYRDNQMTVDGEIYGLPDDGDVFIFYYRKDIFADPENQTQFKEQYGYDLAPPKTWKEFGEIGRFLTDKYAPEMYGAAFFGDPALRQMMFQERFRVEGGRFFDPETMKATVNSDIGVRVLTEMRDELDFMPPGAAAWGFVENLAAFLAGDTAMTISWPPYGRWAAGYGTDEEALSWVPASEIAGKVGYALPPGGHPELAAGFSLAVSASSENKEAAYLFIQWLNSEEISSERVMLPYALRDPFRTAHFESDAYQSLWPDAPEYLTTLQEAANTGLLDLSILQTDRYEEPLRKAFSRLWAGDDPKVILDDVAAQWNAVTEQIGMEAQRAAYEDWASKPNAYPEGS